MSKKRRSMLATTTTATAEVPPPLKLFKNGGVTILCSMRIHGDMKREEHHHAHTSRIALHSFQEAFLEPESNRLTLAHVAHRSNIYEVDSHSPQIIHEVDGLATGCTDHWLGVTYADCPPVLLFDRNRKLAAAIHCGYKSVKSGIIIHLGSLMRMMSFSLKETQAFIGPHICQQCYEYGLEVLQDFPRHQRHVGFGENKHKVSVDLGGIITDQLVNIGLFSGNIQDCRICTCCDERFFSARREGWRPHQVQAGLALIKIDSDTGNGHSANGRA